MITISTGKKMLITCDNWFVAPDGRQYRAAFGTVKAVNDSMETLGVKTNSRSTNWYVELGRLTIAGCQIHYAIECDEVQNGPADDYVADAAHGSVEFKRPTQIYLAD